MSGLDIPLIPEGDPDEGNFSIFLPHLQTDELEEASFEYVSEDDQLVIVCVYDQTEDGEIIGERYPVDVSEIPENILENINQIQVLSIHDWEIDELTDDPELTEQLEELFDHIRTMEQEMTEQMEQQANQE